MKQKNKGFNDINSLKSKLTPNEEGNIIDKYHYLMIHYGYIPFEEFKKMDAYLVGELIEKLIEMNKPKRGKK